MVTGKKLSAMLYLQIALIPLACLLSGVESENVKPTFKNPIFDGNSADPSVLHFGDSYYLTLSTERETQISIFKSEILTSFRGAEEKVAFRAPEGFRDIWASEMHVVDGELYIYFCMARVTGGIRSYVVKGLNASDPMGDWSSHIEMFPEFEHGSTDGTVMVHGNGGKYFVWGSTGGLWIGRLGNATWVEGSKVVLRLPTLDWECSLDAVSNSEQCIVEGPYFIYSHNVSYLVFSAGSTFGPDYVLGLMSIPADKDPMVPANWNFGEDAPVFWRNDEEGVYTTGHATFTTSPDRSEMWMVYHASDTPGNPNGKRVARIDKITFELGGKPVFPRPSGYNHSLTVPSGQLSSTG